MGIIRKKVSIVGSGFTGSSTALMLAQKEIGDIVLVDIPQVENNVKGKALDISQAMAVHGSDVRIIGTSNYDDTKDSDVVIITAGSPRKPGFTRDQLLQLNVNIVETVAKQIALYSPNCMIIVLTNPVDIMTHVVIKATAFPKHRVIGQSGVLDSARLRLFASQALHVSIKDVTALVIGGHNDHMVPLLRFSHVSGVPLSDLFTKEQADGIIHRTQHGGAEIFDLMGIGTYIAPAASLTMMVESIIKDQKRQLCASVLLEGEYGLKDMCLGVPIFLGGNGVERVLDLPLNDEEMNALQLSANRVRELLHSIASQS